MDTNVATVAMQAATRVSSVGTSCSTPQGSFHSMPTTPSCSPSSQAIVAEFMHMQLLLLWLRPWAEHKRLCCCTEVE